MIVYDLLGRCVLSVDLGPETTDRFELNIDHLPAGLYLAAVTTASTREARTFIVAR